MKNAVLLWIGIILAACYTSHSSTQNDKIVSAEEILGNLSAGKAIILKDRQITGDLDFTKVTSSHPISPDAQKVEVRSPIYFENCIFEGSISSYFQDEDRATICGFSSDLIFLNCRIKGDIDLSQSRFKGIFSFVKSEAVGGFKASNAIFYDITDLNGSRFEQDLFLTYSTFQQRSNNMDLTIMGKTYLQGVHYYKESLWSNSIFEQYVDVSKLNSRGSFMMDFCDFRGPLHISGSEFWGYVNITQSKFSDSFTMRTSLFTNSPVLDKNGQKIVQLEKNRLMHDENLTYPSINK